MNDHSIVQSALALICFRKNDGHLFEKVFEKRPLQQLVVFGDGPWDDETILQAELVSHQGVTALGQVSSKCR